MEYNGDIYLSPKHKKEEYKKLNLSLSSDDDVWKKAVEIFDDRISGRYFSQITQLSDNINKNGFAIMALNCLLVETLFQFSEGKSQTPSGKNGTSYASFLQTEFPTAFDSQDKAMRFYKNIRCGILHSAQTTEKSRLTCDESYEINLEDDILSVSVKGFSDLIETYFKEYKKKLLAPSETRLRENFIKKMRYVCRE